MHFEPLIAKLQQAGYPVSTQKLPSVNPTNPAACDVAKAVAFLRENLLLPLLQENREIVLVVHSYGGCVGGAAAKGLSIRERSITGSSGGIVGLVFIAAVLKDEGDSLLSHFGGSWAPFYIVNVRTVLW